MQDCGGPIAGRAGDGCTVCLGLQVVYVDAHDDGAMPVEAERLGVRFDQEHGVARDFPGASTDDPGGVLVYRRRELYLFHCG